MRYLVLNWKMNLTVDKSMRLARSLARLPKKGNMRTIVCPSFSSLNTVARTVRNRGILVGAQNCFWKGSGAFTGEESPVVLHQLGCRYVILGHSERRSLGETNEQIRKKMEFLMSSKPSLIPILCVGESYEQKRAGMTLSTLASQLAVLKKLTTDLVIAYEPVWAISSNAINGAAPVNECADVVDYIRSELGKYISKKSALRAPILYGGSVDRSNVAGYLFNTSINGFLVGGASLNLQSIVSIQTIMSESR